MMPFVFGSSRRSALVLACLLALLSAWLATPAPAQEKPARGPRWIRTTTLRGGQFPQNVAFVVDKSGSMDMDGKDAIAVGEALRLAEQASDESRVRFFTFDSDLHADTQGWIQLPDAEALALARGWLLSQSPGGSTQLAAALERVLALPDTPLGVILISDMGDDCSDLDAVAARIEAAQAKREARAVLGVVAVEPGDPDRAELANTLAGKSGGAALSLKLRSPPP